MCFNVQFNLLTELEFFQEDNGAKFSKIQDNVVRKEKQKFKKTETQAKLYSPGKKFSNNDAIFSRQFQAAKSINDLLDLATLPNLSINNALKIISNITNQINNGKLQMVDIEADERFVHLRKIVQIGDNIRTSNDDLFQYTQLSTPAMIEVSLTCIIPSICAHRCNVFIGDSNFERTRKKKYTSVKDAVIQYC